MEIDEPLEAKDSLEAFEKDELKVLNSIAIALVILISIALVGACAIVILWVALGRAEDVHQRLLATLVAVNQNWRACLIFLLPLFFRPTHKFLMRATKTPFLSAEPLEPKSVPKEQGRFTES